METIFIAILFLALAIAAMVWGADSTETVDSHEWANRKAWYINTYR